jgi:glycosyltransferase involved in cell wall biosynthesis
MDRCDAVAARGHDAHGIEVASHSDLYAWAETGPGAAFAKHTLYPGRRFEEIPVWLRSVRVLAACIKIRATAVFVTNYHRFDTWLVAVALRCLRRRVYLMSDSKFDDKPRAAWRELGKLLPLLSYNGALAAGQRSEAYLRFLGFRRRPIALGFSTLSLGRLVEAAGGASAPESASFAARHFVLIGRFIPEKDIDTAIAAYARYRELADGAARAFHICGAGPLEAAIRAQIAQRGVEGLTMHGFVQREGIARILSRGIALIVPSVSETWGLVVNEALAFCLPVLASERVGARDLLIRTGVNGYIFEPGNVEGLAHLMLRIGHDEAEWRHLVDGSRRFRALADAAHFAEAVEELLRADGLLIRPVRKADL